MESLEWCFSHAVLGNPYHNLGKCFAHTTGVPCADMLNVSTDINHIMYPF